MFARDFSVPRHFQLAMLFRQRKQFQFGLNFANHKYWAVVHTEDTVGLTLSFPALNPLTWRLQRSHSFPIGQNRSDTARLDVHWPCVALWVPKPPNKTAKILFPSGHADTGEWWHVKRVTKSCSLSLSFFFEKLSCSLPSPVTQDSFLGSLTSSLNWTPYSRSHCTLPEDFSTLLQFAGQIIWQNVQACRPPQKRLRDRVPTPLFMLLYSHHNCTWRTRTEY